MKNKRGIKLLISPLQGAKYVQNFLFYLVINDIITVHALIQKGFFVIHLIIKLKFIKGKPFHVMIIFNFLLKTKKCCRRKL